MVEIPAAPQVTGASEGDSNIIKRALELALGTCSEPPEPLQRTMTSINSALPALPTKLLHRIWAEEYIDFGDLPPARSKPRSLPHYLHPRRSKDMQLSSISKLNSTSHKLIDLTAGCSPQRGTPS